MLERMEVGVSWASVFDTREHTIGVVGERILTLCPRRISRVLGCTAYGEREEGGTWANYMARGCFLCEGERESRKNARFVFSPQKPPRAESKPE